MQLKKQKQNNHYSFQQARVQRAPSGSYKHIKYVCGKLEVFSNSDANVLVGAALLLFLWEVIKYLTLWCHRRTLLGTVTIAFNRRKKKFTNKTSLTSFQLLSLLYCINKKSNVGVTEAAQSKCRTLGYKIQHEYTTKLRFELRQRFSSARSTTWQACGVDGNVSMKVNASEADLFVQIVQMQRWERWTD